MYLKEHNPASVRKQQGSKTSSQGTEATKWQGQDGTPQIFKIYLVPENQLETFTSVNAML